MAILFRTISSLNVDGMEARLTVYRGGDRLRIELEPYSSSTATVYSSALQATVTYNGVTKPLARSAFTKAVSAVFDYAADVRQAVLGASGISYRGTTSSSVTVSWKGDGTVPAPTIEISQYSGLVIDQPSRIEWTVGGVPEGYTASTVGVWMYFAAGNRIQPAYTRTVLLSGKSDAAAYEHSLAVGENNVLFYRIAVAVYASPGDAAENYVAYAETDSPCYVSTGTSPHHLAPCNLRYPSAVAKGCPFTIRWEILPAATLTKRVHLQYSSNESNLWYDVAVIDRDTTSYTYTVTQNWESVGFRLASSTVSSQFERSMPVYGKSWARIGKSNLYVGRDGNPVPASGVRVGSAAGGASGGGYVSVGE